MTFYNDCVSGETKSYSQDLGYMEGHMEYFIVNKIASSNGRAY